MAFSREIYETTYAGQDISAGEQFTQLTSFLQGNREFGLSYLVVKATPTNILLEEVILIDDTTVGGAVTINLPPVGNVLGKVFFFKKLGNVGNVTLDGNGTETIDGALTKVLTVQYESVILLSAGDQWYIIG